MIDSVFSPLVYETPFPNDKPLIPVAEIEERLDRIEQVSVNAQVQVIENAVDGLLDRATPFLQNQDLGGILTLSWELPQQLQSSIFVPWEQGWTVGSRDGLAEMRAAIPDDVLSEAERFSRLTYATSAEVQGQVRQLLELQPETIRAVRNQGAEQAVLARVLRLSGDFSGDTLDSVKQHLIAAIQPQPDTGNPISRRELLRRIENTLSVSEVRAENIARTELTNAYNTSRVGTMRRSRLVTHMRFLAISDTRTSEICISRNGMIIPIEDEGAIAANTPALHVRCRSVLSPLQPTVNPLHRRWVEDSDRLYSNRDLVALPKGWNGAQVNQFLPENHVVSINPAYSAAAFDNALNQITNPGAAERVQLFRDFVSVQQIQIVAFDQSRPLFDQLALYREELKYQPGWDDEELQIRTIPTRDGQIGFSRIDQRHITLRTTPGAFEVRSDRLQQMIDSTLDAARGDSVSYGVPVNAPAQGEFEFAIYLHEVGHQVHYAVNLASPPDDIAGSITLYGSKNEREWFAEHFSAWMLDANGYRELDPVGADFIEKSLRQAAITRRAI